MSGLVLGWSLRSSHRWSASLMVVSLCLHIFRVYLTGGFKTPREITWLTGVVMAVLTVSFGVTGYSLPWDQVGFWACKIVTGVPDALPLLGGLVVRALRGGTSVTQSTLSRFFVGHTFILPLLGLVLTAAHFF